MNENTREINEEVINDQYAEIARCDGIGLSGFFVLDSEGNAEWIEM